LVWQWKRKPPALIRMLLAFDVTLKDVSECRDSGPRQASIAAGAARLRVRRVVYGNGKE
jgi:hypothetical protein